ncbi:MAG: hydroxymethylbilane synthase [Candidatus Omnitrophota bacterium]
MYFRIGTRASLLALVQVDEIINLFKKQNLKLNFEINKINTLGDMDKTTPISEIEGTDFFTREIEKALLENKIDMAVHSAKDLPKKLPKGLEIALFTKSIDPYDCLISKENLKLNELKLEAKIGTSSQRRKDQLRVYRKDFNVVDIRGNVEERLRLLEHSDLDAIVIAGAGLMRLGQDYMITQRIPLEILKPHPLQGSLAIEIRENNLELKSILKNINIK